MEKLQRALILIPVVMGIMQGIKQTIGESMKRFMRIITCLVGIMTAYGYVGALEITSMNNMMIIFGGVVLGLAASGLYETTKNITSTVKNI